VNPDINRLFVPVVTTAHAGRPPITWGEADPMRRGPVVATTTNWAHRNVIGAHSQYSLLGGWSRATGLLDEHFVPDLSMTEPMIKIGPHPQWSVPGKIVTFDPFGADIRGSFGAYLDAGYDIRPTIAIHRGKIRLLELSAAVHGGRLKPDGVVLMESGDCNVTKIPIDSVWDLEGIARRLGVDEAQMRRCMYEQSGGMYEQLVSKPELKIFLPPVPNCTILIFGDPAKLTDPSVKLTARLHDQCVSSDVLGSEKCSCRSYLMFAIEQCVLTAQEGGVGLIVYCYLEGRGLGEVLKTLVYNLRDRDGDDPMKYEDYTRQVAGMFDARFQMFKSDPLHWLGVRRIPYLISASREKLSGITGGGIEIGHQVPIPNDRVTPGANTEVMAKEMLHGYAPRGQPN